MKRVAASPATSLWVVPVPARVTASSPGPRVDVPVSSVWTQLPEDHPGDQDDVAVLVGVVAAARGRGGGRSARPAGPNDTPFGVVEGAEGEGVAGLAARFTGREPVQSPTNDDGHRHNDPRASPFASTGLPVRCQHRVVPDRRGGHRGRQGPEHLGHLHPPAGADRGRLDRRRRLRPLPPPRRGPRPDGAPRAGRLPLLDLVAAGAARRGRGRRTRPGSTSTSDWSTGCSSAASSRWPRCTTGTCRRRSRTRAAGSTATPSTASPSTPSWSASGSRTGSSTGSRSTSPTS